MLREEIKRDFIEKSAPPFNLQAEFSKIKIAIPFTKIIRIPEYKGQLSHMLESQETSDTLNLQDDRRKIMFGLKHLLNLEISLHFTSPSPFMICICTMQCLIQVPLTI